MMKFINLTTVLFVMLIADGLILGGMSFSYTPADQVRAQMMGSGMMGHGRMMGSGMINSNTITNMTLDTKALANMTVSIVKDAAIMDDKAFQPNPLTIKVGNTVRWTNDDIVIHTVTSGSGPNDPGEGKQFNSGLLGEGQTVTHTFNKAGEFNYFCLVHPNMIGKVIAK
ncbi:MAG: plastocyanin/azurin family copper-binding protein [Nitrososphaeraceae archaeon]